MVCVDCSCERCERANKKEMERFAEKMKVEYPECIKWSEHLNFTPCFCMECLK